MIVFNFILQVKSYFCTCEFELRANLASVQALDRSISNRKNGSASLREHEETRQNCTFKLNKTSKFMFLILNSVYFSTICHIKHILPLNQVLKIQSS
uniref:Uncharacterized protein n=1 Tax=Cyprinus carpio TaxID=7962 RepID=A0A8C1R6N3_CYPCA